MASHETVDLRVEGAAATILLSRPEALNAWNLQFGHDLGDAVATVANDDAVRAVMITGAGRAFSSGADLKEERVVPDDELMSEAEALLTRLAGGPTTSYTGAKKLLNRVYYADLADQLEAEAAQQKEQGSSADFIEGVLAFVQKRGPDFTGK